MATKRFNQKQKKTSTPKKKSTPAPEVAPAPRKAANDDVPRVSRTAMLMQVRSIVPVEEPKESPAQKYELDEAQTTPTPRPSAAA